MGQLGSGGAGVGAPVWVVASLSGRGNGASGLDRAFGRVISCGAVKRRGWVKGPRCSGELKLFG